MSTASSPPSVNDIGTQAPDAPRSAPNCLKADPFAYLDAVAHARESATSLSCAQALQHASRDHTQLYLSLLVPELRRLVDRGLRTQAWHSAEGLQHVVAPELRQFPSVPRYAVLRSGERVICLDSASVSDTCAVLVRLDLPVGDAQRKLRLPGRLVHVLDLRPYEVQVLVAGKDFMQLCDINGGVVARWPHDDCLTQIDQRWLRRIDTLWDMARPAHTFRIPDHARIGRTFPFGAEGAEYLFNVDQANSVHLYDLHSSKLLYRLSPTHAQEWEPKPAVGALLGIEVLKSVPGDPGTELGDILGLDRNAPDRPIPRVSIYALTTGELLVPLSPIVVLREIEASALLLQDSDSNLLKYWSPRDPHNIRSLLTDHWRLLHSTLCGDLLIFAGEAEYLMWRWGAATAVRVAAPEGACLPSDTFHHHNGAAFLLRRRRSIIDCVLYMLVMPDTEEAAVRRRALPLTLPPATQVTLRDVYRARPDYIDVIAPIASEVDAPLVFTKRPSGRALLRDLYCLGSPPP